MHNARACKGAEGGGDAENLFGVAKAEIAIAYRHSKTLARHPLMLGLGSCWVVDAVESRSWPSVISSLFGPTGNHMACIHLLHLTLSASCRKLCVSCVTVGKRGEEGCWAVVDGNVC